MTRETFDRIMKETSDHLIAVVLYCWGEPFLNKDICYMIEQCTKRDIITITSTNGHYLQTLEEALEVVDAGLSALVIALDGSEQAIYEDYRKKGEVDKVKRCAELVERAKAIRGSDTPFTNLRTVLTQNNKEDIPRLEVLARELGVDMFSYKSLGCLTDAPEYINFEPEIDSLQRFRDKRGKGYGNKMVRCPYPFRQPTIFWDGTVVGCEFDYDTSYSWGEITKHNARRIWNSSKARELRKRLRRNETKPKFCTRCPYKNKAQDRVVLEHKLLKH